MTSRQALYTERTVSRAAAPKFKRYAKKVAKKAKSREGRLRREMASTDWVRARMQHDLEPSIEAEPTKNLEKALKHSKDYDIVLLDGAPGSPKRTSEMMPASDLIILPTGASRADLMPTLALARRPSSTRRVRRSMNKVRLGRPVS